MHGITTATHNCRIAATPVQIVRQAHQIGGIGEPERLAYDYQCSREESCPHRISPACTVQRLNR
jgi:hypothetical protein